MSRELKVYNRFDELIAHLRLVPGYPVPLQIVDGTPELRAAVRALAGYDFDRTVVVANHHRRFTAAWGTPEYLDALAGYWSSNFGWRTKIINRCLVASHPTAQSARSAEYGLFADQQRSYPGRETFCLQVAFFSNVATDHPTNWFVAPMGALPARNLTTYAFTSALALDLPFTVAEVIENNPSLKPSQPQVGAAA